MNTGWIYALAFLLAGCPHPKPPQPPQPSPTPAPQVVNYHPEMLLHVEGMNFVDTAGKIIKPVYAVSDTLNFSWALASRQHWQDPLKPHLAGGPGTPFFHVRNGAAGTDPTKPYFADQIGGEYIRTDGIKYDLNQFNPVYYNELTNEIEYAGSWGAYVQVSSVGGGDGWVIKTCGHHPERVPDWFCTYLPQNNVQGQNWYFGGGKLPLGYVPELHTRKLVSETCRFGNVIYELSTESNLIPGWDPQEELAWVAVIRDEETKNGCPRHLIGTNSANQTVIRDPRIDYVEWHNNLPIDPAWCAGKPCGVNEYGGQDATPQQFADRFCQAQARGTWYGLWAEDMTQADFNHALDLVKGGCQTACVHPPDLVLPPLAGREFQTDYLAAVEALKRNRNDLFSAPYGTPGDDVIRGWTATSPDMTPGSPRYQLFMTVTSALAAEACKLGYQAGAEGDEDFVLGKAGFCEYRHHIAFGPGRLMYDGAWGPDAFYKGRFECPSSLRVDESLATERPCTVKYHTSADGVFHITWDGPLPQGEEPVYYEEKK